MDRRAEAMAVLRDARQIARSAVGSRLPLTKPRLSEWSPKDHAWMATVALWLVVNDHNKGEGPPALADIERLMPKVMRRFQIKATELK
jgi:hypothetical protein